MSETIKKTNPIVRFIGNRLGLVSQEEIADFMKKAQGVSQQNRPLQRSSMLIGQSIAPDLKADEYLQAYKGVVFSCVSAIAQEVANIQLNLFKRKGQNEFEQVEQHPVLDLLYKVNPLYTSYLLWEATSAYLELTGESFWWLVGPQPQPREIWALRPDWVTIKDTSDRLISNYVYGPPGTPEDKKIVIPFDQMVHFKDFSPRNPYRGFGAVKAGAKSIDENEYQQDYSRNFFYNSALPGGALSTDQTLGDDQYERVKEDWEATHRGSKKAWKVAILEGGLSWQDIGMTRKEMDFIEGRRLTRDEILMIFRVPKAIIAVNDDVNRAASRESRAIFLENNITHKMKRIVSFLNEFLLPRYGDDTLFFDYVNPVPNDESAKLNYYKTALGGAPFLTVNEVRELEDREPIEGGEKLLTPFGLADSGGEMDEEKQAEQAEKMRQRALRRFNVRVPVYPYTKHKMDVFAKQIEDLTGTLLTKIMQGKAAKAGDIHKLSTKNGDNVVEGDIVDENREQFWRTIITRTDPREITYKRLLTELFTKQEGDVKDRIDLELQRVAPGAKMKASVSDIADVTKDDTVFTGSLMDFIRGVIENEGIAQIQSIVEHGLFYMQSNEVQKYLKKEGVKFISSINKETTDLLRDTLAEGVEKKESIPDLKKRVESVYEDAKGFRAERIARSEVLRATNFSSLEAYRQSGVVEAKEWLTAKDERTCAWCGPQDGKQLGLKENYFDEGDTVTGKNDKGKKVFLKIGLGDVKYPPLHPNCRCTLIPIVVDDEKAAKKGITIKKSAPNKSLLLTQLANATIEEIKKNLGSTN